MSAVRMLSLYKLKMVFIVICLKLCLNIIHDIRNLTNITTVITEIKSKVSLWD